MENGICTFAKMFACKLMTELCFNIWYYLEPDQTISALAAKAYLLEGSEKEKADVLRSLSRHDFKTVPAYELPANVKHYVVEAFL